MSPDRTGSISKSLDRRFTLIKEIPDILSREVTLDDIIQHRLGFIHDMEDFAINIRV